MVFQSQMFGHVQPSHWDLIFAITQADVPKLNLLSMAAVKRIVQRLAVMALSLVVSLNVGQCGDTDAITKVTYTESARKIIDVMLSSRRELYSGTFNAIGDNEVTKAQMTTHKTSSEVSCDFDLRIGSWRYETHEPQVIGVNSSSELTPEVMQQINDRTFLPTNSRLRETVSFFARTPEFTVEWFSIGAQTEGPSASDVLAVDCEFADRYRNRLLGNPSNKVASVMSLPVSGAEPTAHWIRTLVRRAILCGIGLALIAASLWRLPTVAAVPAVPDSPSWHPLEFTPSQKVELSGIYMGTEATFTASVKNTSDEVFASGPSRGELQLYRRANRCQRNSSGWPSEADRCDPCPARRKVHRLNCHDRCRGSRDRSCDLYEVSRLRETCLHSFACSLVS